jgi:hypothetical protein
VSIDIGMPYAPLVVYEALVGSGAGCEGVADEMMIRGIEYDVVTG